MARAGDAWDVACLAGIVDARPLWRRALEDRAFEAARAASLREAAAWPLRCEMCHRVAVRPRNVGGRSPIRLCIYHRRRMQW